MVRFRGAAIGSHRPYKPGPHSSRDWIKYLVEGPDVLHQRGSEVTYPLGMYLSSQTWARKTVGLCSGRNQGDSLVNQGREGHKSRLRLDLGYGGGRADRASA